MKQITQFFLEGESPTLITTLRRYVEQILLRLVYVKRQTCLSHIIGFVYPIFWLMI